MPLQTMTAEVTAVVYQVVGFFDVAARLCAGDGPIAALVGGSSCNIGSALQHHTSNDYKNNITVYRLLTTTEHVFGVL